MIKVFDGGMEKILVFHNHTRGTELVEDLASLESYYTWKWKVEPANNGGWFKITNPDGLFLTTKLNGVRSTLSVEKECKYI